MAIDEGQRQPMLILIEYKWGKLLEIDDILSKAAPSAEIQTHLNANGIERSLLKAIHDQIDSGSDFKFPSSAQIAAFRKAVSDLDDVVRKSGGIDALVKAGNTLIEAMPADGIKS
jgi:hypothetical protein